MTAPPLNYKVRIASAILAGFSILLGLFVIIGWHVKSELMIKIIPSVVPMAYNTALCFIIGGCVLIMLLVNQKYVVYFLSGIIGGFSFLSLVQDILQLNFGIDGLFFKQDVLEEVLHPGRLSPITAACFLFYAVSLFFNLHARKHQNRSLFSFILSIPVVALGAFGVMLYLLGVKMPYGAGSFMAMSFPTAFGFIVLGGGALLVNVPAMNKAEAIQLVGQGRFAFFILITSIMMTFVTAWSVRAATENQMKIKFNQMVSDGMLMIKARTEFSESILHSASGLFAASKSVERSEWREFVKALNLEKRFPGIKAIRYLEYIRGDDTERFINEIKNDLLLPVSIRENFNIYPTKARSEHVVIKYVEPQNENTLSTLGFDLAAEARRFEILKRAQASGEAIATGRIVLVPEGEPGFLVFLPIYRNDAEIKSEEDRRNALVGYVSFVFQADETFGGELSKGLFRQGISLELFVGEFSPTVVNSKKLIYKNHPGVKLSDAPRFSEVKQIEVFGQKWSAFFRALPSFGSDAAIDRFPLFILSGGLVLSFLIFSSIYSLGYSRTQAVMLAGKITEHLRESEERNRLIVETANDAFISMSSSGNVIEWNHRAEAMFGWSRSEACGRSLAELVIPQKYRDVHAKGIARFLATGSEQIMNRQVEVEALHRDGHEFLVELTVWPIRGADGYTFNAFVRDIAKRKVMEERIRRINQCLVNFSPNPIDNVKSLTALAGELMSANCAFYEHIENEAMAAVSQWQVPEGFTFQTQTEGHVCYDAMTNAKGELFFVPDLQNTPYAKNDPNINAYGLKAYIGMPVKKRGEAVGSLSVLYRGTFVPTQAEEELMGILASAIGVEEERLEEEEQLAKAQSQLAQAERAALTNQLAIGVAHEVKNPLAILELGLNYLSRHFQGDDAHNNDAHTVLGDMNNAIERADRIIKGLMDVSKPFGVEFRPEDLNAIIEKSLLLVKHRLDTAKIKVVQELYNKNLTIKADQGRLIEVFINLFNNAIEAMPAGGQLTVRLRPEQSVSPVYIRDRGKGQMGQSSGELAVIEIEDTGKGVVPDDLKKIFEPFFTTKRAKGGTGLGLSITKSIVDAHRGMIFIENKTAEPGVKVTVVLPLQ